MRKIRWDFIAWGGFLIAMGAIISDWELRASIAYLGGILFGYGLAQQW